MKKVVIYESKAIYEADSLVSSERQELGEQFYVLKEALIKESEVI